MKLGSWWRQWRYGEKPPARRLQNLADGAVLSIVTWGDDTSYVLVKNEQRIELTYREADQLYWIFGAHLGNLPKQAGQ